MEEVEPSGSGTWPMVFYQSERGDGIERWVPGEGREDVSSFHNNYDTIKQALRLDSGESIERTKTSFRVRDLLEAGLLRPGDALHTRKRPELCATVVDARFVEHDGKKWKYNDWGAHVNGWAAINIYLEMVLDRTGQTLDDLRMSLANGDV